MGQKRDSVDQLVRDFLDEAERKGLDVNEEQVRKAVRDALAEVKKIPR